MNSKQRRKARRAVKAFYATMRKAVCKYVVATEVSRGFKTPLQEFLENNKTKEHAGE